MEPMVCIIGAGGSGLAAAHALAEREIPFVIHEAREGLGGNWRYDPEPGRSSSYASLHTNTSRCEISRVAKSVTISYRATRTVTARRIGPIPVDLFDTELSHLLLPWSIRRRLTRLIVRLATGDQRRAGLPHERRVGDIRLSPSDDLVRLLRRGRVGLAPPITELRGDRVLVRDGRELPAQALLLATGYEVVFPFLPHDLELPSYEHGRLYRGIASTAAPNLFFIGVVNGHRALIPAAEAQAAWVAEVLSGRLTLPAVETQRASVAADAAVRARAFDPRCGLMYDAGPYTRALRREARRAQRRPGEARRAGSATVVTR